MRLPHFHITFSKPNNVWPNGCWSGYQINGDEIAQRIKFDDDGKVVARHSWSGYLGTFATLQELTAAIEQAKAGG